MIPSYYIGLEDNGAQALFVSGEAAPCIPPVLRCGCGATGNLIEFAKAQPLDVKQSTISNGSRKSDEVREVREVRVKCKKTVVKVDKMR